MPSLHAFSTLINQMSDQVKAQLAQAGSNEFEVALAYAIRNWCSYLEVHPNLNHLFSEQVTYKILSQCGEDPVPQLTYNVYQEWRNGREKNSGLIAEFLENSTGLSLLVNKILRLLKINEEDLKFTVLFAFVIVAVLFLNLIINTPPRVN